MRRYFYFFGTALIISLFSALTFASAPGNNSWVKLSRNLYLADLNNDNRDEFLQITGNRLLAFKNNSARSGLLHKFFEKNVSRVVVGDFQGNGFDQLCLVFTDNFMTCYEYRVGIKELRNWITQRSFFVQNDVHVVADFNGDGRDEVLFYNRFGGSFYVYSYQTTGFSGMPDFDSGDLANDMATQFRFKLFAGDFNGDGRSDVIAFTPDRKVRRYDSVLVNGSTKFVLNFSTAANAFSADEVPAIAKINLDSHDDIAFHTPANGAVRFTEASINSRGLIPISIGSGQIKIAANTQLFWTQNKGNQFGTAGMERHDAMVFETNNNLFTVAHARLSNGNPTYWLSFSQFASDYDLTWPTPSRDTWGVIRCKFQGTTQTVGNDNYFRDLLSSPYTESAHAYYRDVSYGAFLIDYDLYPGWHEMDIDFEQGRNKNMSRQERIWKCVDASGVHSADYHSMIAIMNISRSNGNNYDAGHQGGVLATPKWLSPSFFNHEMLHNYGLRDSYDDSATVLIDWADAGAYCDIWDMMSYSNVLANNNSTFGQAGPELNASNKFNLNWLPTNRVKQLASQNGRAEATVMLAAINRPEARGYLAALVQLDATTYYTVEFRQKSQWDSGIHSDAVLVHEWDGSKTILQTGGIGALAENHDRAELVPGENRMLKFGNVVVVVQSFNNAEQTATVKITY